MNTLIKKIFLKKDRAKELIDDQNDPMLRLMIEIAISDGTLDKSELMLIQEIAKKIAPESKNISLKIKKTIDENKESVSFYPTIKKINETYSINQKKELLRDLWELVVSDSIIDPYEENLYFKIAELIKIKRSYANQIKQGHI